MGWLDYHVSFEYYSLLKQWVDYHVSFKYYSFGRWYADVANEVKLTSGNERWGTELKNLYQWGTG